MYPPPTVSIEEHARSTRLLGFWGAGVGLALLLLLLVPVLTTFGFTRWGDELTGPSDGAMFHGGEVFFAWLVANAVALLGILVLAVVALVLDIMMLVKLNTLQKAGAGTAATRPLLIAVLAGSALISTPIIGMLMLVPGMVFGPGRATDTALVVLLVVMFLVPVAGRVAEAVAAAQLPNRLAAPGAGAPAATGPVSW